MDTQAHAPIRGVLNIKKPLGMSSMTVCTVVRAKLRAGGAPKRVKVGHGGTLDPLASGVLVVLVGKATREQDRVMGSAKGYRAVVDLQHRSESHDLEQRPMKVDVDRIPTRADLDRVLAAFEGVIEQSPPAFSAIKVDGKRSYENARAGDVAQLKARPVRIDAIRVHRYEYPELEIDIACGKGTYIRSLARDIGDSLGTGGMLIALERTKVGAFEIDRSLSLDDLGASLDPWSLTMPDDLGDAPADR